MAVSSPAGRPLWVMAKGYAPDEGGMQTYAQQVAEAWADTGAQVTVFSQTSRGPRRAIVGPVTLIDIGPGKSPLVPLRFIRAMRRELKASGAPALVHGTTWRTSLLPMVLGLPYVTTFHGREFMYGGRIALGLMRRVARRARAIVAVSHYSASRLRDRLGPGYQEPLVAWNGTSGPPAEARPQGKAVPLIFSLCRLEPRKNIAACIRACAAVRQRGLAFRYVVGGRGPELERIGALLRELGLEDCVEVAGFMGAERVAELHAEADIFLHPQIEIDGGRDFEGFGIVIADAMVAETAVIVGADGGARELVRESGIGVVIDGRDEEALATALQHLLSDPAARARMAQAAKAHACENFRWDRHVARIAAALEA